MVRNGVSKDTKSRKIKQRPLLVPDDVPIQRITEEEYKKLREQTTLAPTIKRGSTYQPREVYLQDY